MKRALVYASVAAQIHNFNMNNIRLLQEQGYLVDVACNMDSNGTISEERIITLRKELEEMNVRVYHIPLTRKITEISALISSVHMSKQIISENQYSLIHCHSPIGSVVCRIANRMARGYKERKVIYTAHGFHFYKGAPLVNWLIYYTIEKLCSHFTDVIVTINQEDRLLAERKMKANKVEYLPGIGVDTKKILNTIVDIEEKRKMLGISPNAFLLLSVGELNRNKNHETVIRALKELPDDIHYAVAGKGDLIQYLMDVAIECNVEARVHLLGYRSDIAGLLKIADLFVFPSYREGLPVSVMEAMAAEKAVICSKIRGNVDLIDQKQGGILVPPSDVESYVKAISYLYQDANMRLEMGKYNLNKVRQFDISKINKKMAMIYKKVVM